MWWRGWQACRPYIVVYYEMKTNTIAILFVGSVALCAIHVHFKSAMRIIGKVLLWHLRCIHCLSQSIIITLSHSKLYSKTQVGLHYRAYRIIFCSCMPTSLASHIRAFALRLRYFHDPYLEFCEIF